MNFQNVWDKVFGFKRGDKVFLKSIGSNPGDIIYEYYTILEVKQGRYLLRRERNGLHTWYYGDNLERWEDNIDETEEIKET